MGAVAHFKMKQKDNILIGNSGNYSTFCPEFSKGQFLKTGDTINRIVHSKISIGFTEARE